jgi:hypothetical protein
MKSVADSMLSRGLSAAYIAKDLTERLNMPVGAPTILNHRNHYEVPIDASNRKDLAILVRDEAVAAVIEGRLEPTISHGLSAQALIDRRAEKGDEHLIRLAFARAILGGGSVTGLLAPPDLVIEGEAVEIG